MVQVDINASLGRETSSPTAPEAFVCNVYINHTSAALG